MIGKGKKIPFPLHGQGDEGPHGAEGKEQDDGIGGQSEDVEKVFGKEGAEPAAPVGKDPSGPSVDDGGIHGVVREDGQQEEDDGYGAQDVFEPEDVFGDLFGFLFSFFLLREHFLLPVGEGADLPGGHAS